MRRHLALLVALLLLATACAAYGLNADLLFVDEYWSVYKSGGYPYGPASVSEIMRRLTAVDPGGMGALYYYSLAGWNLLTGASPFAVRAFSLLTGLLGIAWAYRLGRALFSPQVGLYAAAVMSASAFYINFMHEARAYTLVALFSIMAIWAYWQVLHHPRRRYYVLLVVSLAMLAYSHYVALAIYGVIGVYHLLFVPRNRRWFKVVWSVGIATILYLPWTLIVVVLFRLAAADTNRQAHSMNAGQAAATLVQAFSNGSLALLLLLAVLGLQFMRTRDLTRSPVVLVWVWLIVGLAAALVVNAVVPFLVHIRYLMFLWGALALIVALGVWALAKRGVNPALIVGAWLIVGVWQTTQPGFIEGLFGSIYRAPAAGVYAGLELLRGQTHEDDLLLFHISAPTFEPFQLFVLDYLVRDRGIVGGYDQIERINNSFAVDDAGYQADIVETLTTTRRIWTLRVPGIPTTQRTLIADRLLHQNYANCGTVLERPDIQVALHLHRPERLGEYRRAMPYTFGNNDTGRVRVQLADPLRVDGDLLPVLLTFAGGEGFNAAATSAGAYSVALHIDNADGALVGQTDYGLPAGRFACHLTELPVSPGTYTLYAIVYNWQTGERLPVEGTEDNRISLGTFTVER